MKNQLYSITKKPAILMTTAIFLFFAEGCKKFVTVETPVTSISSESAFRNESSASSVLTGIYGQMSDFYYSGMKLGALSILADLSADNLTLFDINSHSIPDLPRHYLNNFEPGYKSESDQTYWKNTYSLLYSINFSVEQLKGNANIKEAVSRRLLGEAYFLRAFNYFYLVNLYGGVPLVLTTQYKINSTLKRSSEEEVYAQILSDLTQAEYLLDNRYVSPDVTISSTDRLRPNLAAVNALKARVYLYQQKYSEAEAASTKVIDQTSLYSLSNLSMTFLKNSSETIWALQPVLSNLNTWEAYYFIITSNGPDSFFKPFYASESLVNSFEQGDSRKNSWIGNISVGGKTFYFPAKYKVGYGASTIAEYNIVLRLSEQYLIRAEARNEQGNILGAVNDLNSLRARSRSTISVNNPNPLPALSVAISQSQLRQAVMQERRVELFTEWGHRWFDLKRTGNIDAVLTTQSNIKDGRPAWATYKKLYPIPISDILLNPSITQNPGYSN